MRDGLSSSPSSGPGIPALEPRAAGLPAVTRDGEPEPGPGGALALVGGDLHGPGRPVQRLEDGETTGRAQVTGVFGHGHTAQQDLVRGPFPTPRPDAAERLVHVRELPGGA